MSVNITVARIRSGSRRLPRAGQELLDLADIGIGVADEEEVIVARQLDEPRARDAARPCTRARSTGTMSSPVGGAPASARGSRETWRDVDLAREQAYHRLRAAGSCLAGAAWPTMLEARRRAQRRAHQRSRLMPAAPFRRADSMNMLPLLRREPEGSRRVRSLAQRAVEHQRRHALRDRRRQEQRHRAALGYRRRRPRARTRRRRSPRARRPSDSSSVGGAGDGPTGPARACRR